MTLSDALWDTILILLAQREYRKCHDKVALWVHWEICRKYGVECTDKWYNHQPLAVTENREVRITWDMTVYTDKKLNHNRPDITLVQKDTQEWTLTDIAVPADQNIISILRKRKWIDIRT